jgi:serine/threonine protein phosphatase 1
VAETNKAARGTSGRTVAVGDVHGCSVALAALLRAVAPGPDDTLVTLGDYIDRGPDAQGVIEQLLALAGRCQLVPLRGNHEEMLFAARAGRDDLRGWLKFGGGRTLASYGIASPQGIPGRHLDFLKGCRRYHETDAHLFVHANYRPNRPLAEQPENALLWEHLDLEKAAPHYSGKAVVVGHTPQPDGDVLDLGFLAGIDTGCCAGGWLTALDVGTGRYWQANQRGEVREGRLAWFWTRARKLPP